jgi:glycosyltransferase involved in cell wall biosynthesis
MKIGLYSTSSIPTKPVLDGYGGVEPFVGSLAEYYEKKGHEIHLFAAEGSYVPKKGTLHSFPKKDLAESLIENGMFNAYKREDFLDVDILHDNSHWHVPGAQLVPSINYLFTLHALQTNVRDFDLDKYKYNATALSYDYAKFIKWLDPKVNIRTVQDGINLKYYPFKKEKGERFLWLSRIFPPKGAHIAIEAAERAKVPIDIVGGSPVDVPGYLDQLKRKCARSKYAKFVGEVSHKEKIKYLQDAKAVILPLSQLEHKPNGQTQLWIEAACMIPLEANACGTPVITCPNGLTGEVVAEGINGFIAISVEDFVEKIKRVDEIDTRMCRCRAEYFSFDKTAEKFLSLYEDIINGISW